MFDVLVTIVAMIRIMVCLIDWNVYSKHWQQYIQDKNKCSNITNESVQFFNGVNTESVTLV